MARSDFAGRLPTNEDFLPASWRGGVGYFRIAQTRGGIWWLVTPEGDPVVLRAVAGVNRHGRAGLPPERTGAYARMVMELYGARGAGWARATAARLHAWGVDTVGPWGGEELADHGLYFTALADFTRAAVPLLNGYGLRLPDVFDARWSEAAEAHAAAVVAPWAGRRGLVGWFTDDGLGWGGASLGALSALQVCLSLEPSFAAHHAAWEFASAAHAGDGEALARAWGLARASREHVRQFTRGEQAITAPGFLDDAARFDAELARRYFAVAGKALRAADPGRLVLGARFAVPPPPNVRSACARQGMDAVSWRLRAGVGFAAQAEAAGGEDVPQWITGGGLAHGDFHRLPIRDGTGPTRLERLLRANREGMVAACRSPQTVGIEWAHWADAEDEAPPFGAGLVHADDREAHEHTELLAHVHRRAVALHAGAR